MPTVKALLRTTKMDGNGAAPIYLRISDAEGSRFLSLGVRLHPSHWNEKQGKVRRSHPNADELNALVSARVAEAEGEILRKKVEGGAPTAD
ncbi:MAG TPA: Arm DNA-binding domain-containing protein, partial [Rubricoccaceae bacterium]|nr:Arm DNA-binding domain-containing protein [Rubricoccaceae bacterium]